MQEDIAPLVPEEVIARLYPRIRPEDRREAAVNLAQYIDVTLRIFDRIRQDPEAWARFEALTAGRHPPTLKEPHPSHARPQPP